MAGSSDRTATISTDVVIVGMGPVGDVLAGLLAQRGVKVFAVEREARPYTLPRAASFDHEIMRVFQELGVADAIRQDARVMTSFEIVNAARETLMYFTASDNAISGWAQSYLCHQPSIEAVLRQRLSELPGIDLRLSHTFTALLRNDEEGVLCEITDDKGEAFTVASRFLVGCDGGSSPVRVASGIALFDYGFEEPWLVIDVLMDDETGLAPHCIQFCDPARPTTALPMAPGRRRWEFMLLPGETAEQAMQDSFVAELLAKHVEPDRIQVVRRAVYRFHGLVGENWRAGSVLIAGDAAHQMPPFLGQGMCSGIRDAANLAWKLAMILKGEAKPSLLDTYLKERAPHVRSIIESAIGVGRMICTLDHEVARRRDSDLLAARDAGQAPPDVNSLIPSLIEGCLSPSPRSGQLFPQPVLRGVRLDDLTGDRFALLTLGKPPENLPAYVKCIEIEGISELADWQRDVGAEAVLVRPDRYIFGTGGGRDLIERLRECLEAGAFSV